MRQRILIMLLTGSIIISVIVVANTIDLGSINNDNKPPIDGRQEYKKLYTRYKSDSSIHVSGTITLYDGEKNLALKEKTEFRFIRSGTHSVTHLSNLQIVCNGSISVQLDTVNKYILLTKDNNQQKQYSTSATFPFEAFLSDRSPFKVELRVTQSGKNRVMQISSDFNPELKSASITYNPQTYNIAAADIYWWKDAIKKGDGHENNYWLTKISYSYLAPKNFDANDVIDKMIRNRDGKIEPVGLYRDYEVSISN